MKPMNKGLCLLLVAAMILMLAACGNGNNASSRTGQSSSENSKEGSSPQEKLKITMWSQFADPNSKDGGFIGFYKALEATQAHFPDVEIEHLGFGGDTYKTKVQAASAADELPDIFYAWGGGFSQPFVAGGRILPLDDLIKDGTSEKLIEGTTGNFTFDGQLYGLPTTIASSQLYVNKELFEKAGTKVPETWDELAASVKALDAAGIQPVALGAKDRWPALFWNAILNIRMGGVDAMNAALAKKGSFDTPEFVQASAKLKELIDLGAFGEHYLGTSYDDSVNMFLSGKAAMLLMGAWVNGQIEADDSPVKGKVEAIKFPTIPEGKGNADEWYGGSGETFVINSKVENKEQVWEVYKYFIEAMAKEVFLAGSGSSAWKGEMGDTSQMNALAKQIGELSSTATGFSYWWDQMLAGNDSESMFSALMKFIAGKMSPEEYNKELQAKIVPGT